MNKIHALTLTSLTLTSLLGLSCASAQTTNITPAALNTEPVRVWGSLSSELIIIPGLTFGVSFPVGHTQKWNLALRPSLEAYFDPLVSSGTPLLVWNADLLFNRPGDGLQTYLGTGISTYQANL